MLFGLTFTVPPVPRIVGTDDPALPFQGFDGPVEYVGRIGVKPKDEPADNGDVPLSVMVGDLVGTVGPEYFEGDPHEIGIVIPVMLSGWTQDPVL